jgi:hypothetical protein
MSRYGMFILLGIVLLERNVRFSFIGYSNVTPLDIPGLALMHVFAGPWITGALFGG